MSTYYCMGNLIKEHFREFVITGSLLLTKPKPSPQYLENCMFRLLVVVFYFKSTRFQNVYFQKDFSVDIT